MRYLGNVYGNGSSLECVGVACPVDVCIIDVFSSIVNSIE